MSFPTGTVTFLFTDIEGSTRLWEAEPDRMRVSLAHHDALLRTAIEANSGTVFKEVGDAFYAAFSTVREAVGAVIDAQRELIKMPADGRGLLSLRVRMAIHTGAAQHRNLDYYGQPLNRAARLLATAHGGQALLSQTACDQVCDLLPAGVALCDLGQHRLRDLSQPEHIFQILHPDLPNDFPPLRSLGNTERLTNLPPQVTSFIGREKEIDTVKSLLANTRLLTLTGSGGCGKTRLSLQVAAAALEDHSDGVWIVELAPIAEPALLAQSVAQCLNVKEEPGRTTLQVLVDFLTARTLLLVLDNCEHLLDACARLADCLIRTCPKVRILATSREPLGIGGEQAYRVPSLSLPDLRSPSAAESLLQYEAVRLFIERALAVKPEFSVTDANAPALAQLCVRLDGIPLAIELSAARVRMLSVEEINNKLGNRFRLLTGGSRTALPRHQTLRALIDWSFDLLNHKERDLLCRASVFVGGWSLAGLESVGVSPNVDEWEVFDLLTSLVDKSLVLSEQEGDRTRYNLLETVRQYARDRLLEAGELHAARDRHLAFFVSLAEETQPYLSGPDSSSMMVLLEREHDNLRTALEWSLTQPEFNSVYSDVPVRLVAALTTFWYARGHHTEGRKWLADALNRATSSSNLESRMNALNGSGQLAIAQGDYTAARSLYDQGLTLARQLGNNRGITDAMLSLGAISETCGEIVAAEATCRQILAMSEETNDNKGVALALGHLSGLAITHGDFDSARPMMERSLALFDQLGDRIAMIVPLLILGATCRSQGDTAAAREAFATCIELSQELRNKRGSAYALGYLGEIEHEQDNDSAAEQHFIESVGLFRELGDRAGLALSLTGLGLAAERRGDLTVARSLFEEGLTLRQAISDTRGLIISLEAISGLELAQARCERAARIWGAMEAHREAFGCPMKPYQLSRYGHQVAMAREAIGNSVFNGAWALGRTQTMEQAIAFALEGGSDEAGTLSP